MILTNSKDIAGFRAFLTSQKEQACSAAAKFTGPLKQALEDLGTKFADALAKLPAADASENSTWCIENQLDNLFCLLTQATACASLASLEIAKTTNSEQLASSVTAEINRRVAAGELFTVDGVALKVKTQIEAGELVPKVTLEQLCSSAKLTGFSEGQAKVREELAAEVEAGKVIALRKTALQEAGLPLPEAELERVILGADDAAFQARKAAFIARQAELTSEGIQLNADGGLANLWLDEAPYKSFKKLVASVPALKFKPNPVASVPGDATKPAGTPTLIIC